MADHMTWTTFFPSMIRLLQQLQLHTSSFTTHLRGLHLPCSAKNTKCLTIDLFNAKIHNACLSSVITRWMWMRGAEYHEPSTIAAKGITNNDRDGQPLPTTAIRYAFPTESVRPKAKSSCSLMRARRDAERSLVQIRSSITFASV